MKKEERNHYANIQGGSLPISNDLTNKSFISIEILLYLNYIYIYIYFKGKEYRVMKLYLSRS